MTGLSGIGLAMVLLVAAPVQAAGDQERFFGLDWTQVVRLGACAADSTALAYEQAANEAARLAAAHRAPDATDSLDAMLLPVVLESGAGAMAACVERSRLPVDATRVRSCYAMRYLLPSEVDRLRRKNAQELDALAARWDPFVPESQRGELRVRIQARAGMEDDPEVTALRLAECMHESGSALELSPEAFVTKPAQPQRP
jgi:hypothetical protein